MAKTAVRAVPNGDQKAPEGRKNRIEKNPAKAEPRVEARSLQGTFAKSICKAHDLATMKEREACEDGVPCSKLPECMGYADGAIRYLEKRKEGRKT